MFWLCPSHFRTPKTPIELAIDFILHDFEMAGRLLTSRLTFTVRICTLLIRAYVREADENENGEVSSFFFFFFLCE